MVARVQLPPSERDFETYRLVKVELKTTREAAELMGVSQTRVCQILTRVEEHLLCVAVSAEDQDSRERRLYVARQVAAERLDYFQSLALQGFVRSQGEAIVIREAQNPGEEAATVTTVRSTAGDCRYLLAAARMAVLASKVPALSLSESIFAPPVEDCSNSAAEQSVASEVADDEVAASDSKAEDCVKDAALASHLENYLSNPVQATTFEPWRTDANDVLKRPLSKKERRARRALLAKTG